MSCTERQFRCQMLPEDDYANAWACVAISEQEAAGHYLTHLREIGVETYEAEIRVMRIESVIFRTRIELVRVNPGLERAVMTAARVADIGRYG